MLNLYFFGPVKSTAKQLDFFASLNARIADTNSRLHQLYLHTLIEAGRARDLARSGQKDLARNWSRYFSNSQIFKILADSGCIEAGQLDELKRVLAALHDECHPLDVAVWDTDISAIRAHLEKMLHLLIELKQPVFSFHSISPVRSSVTASARSFQLKRASEERSGESLSDTNRN